MADGGAHEAAAASAWFTPALALISAAVGAFGLWLANRMLGKAAFEQAMNARFQVLMERTEAFHASERLAWNQRELRMLGEIVNLKQTVATLTNALRNHGVIGIPEAEYPDPIITIPPDDPS